MQSVTRVLAFLSCVGNGRRMQKAMFAFNPAAKASDRVSRSVAVIGGGSAGIVAARFLKRAGHRPKLFEAGTSFGGVWADNPTNKVVYNNLQTNLPTCVMQSPDLDFPAGLPSYVTKPQLGAYIESYAHEFGVTSLTTFGATVTHVTPSEEEQDRWTVEWMCDDAPHRDIFDAVVVANGHYEKPYKPELPGEKEWLAADASRAIVHSCEYKDAEEFRGQSVLVVGGRSSGVDISRMLHGVAKWVYVLEKKCSSAVTHEGEAVTHVPVGTRLSSDGRLRFQGEDTDMEMPGPPVERVVLATGYVYEFPFLDEASVGLRFRGERYVTPLFQHLLHATRPTLGFIGIPLAVPCPIPFFECQAAYLAEFWARPSDGPAALAPTAERVEWVEQRRELVGDRPQDMHATGVGNTTAWSYLRELLTRVQADNPPTPEGESWVERSDWEFRLTTVEDVYKDRVSRQPKKPWQDDSYRRCEYSVDWASGHWIVDDKSAQVAMGA